MPLIIVAPWLAGGGRVPRSDALVELTDVYPTIAALAGLPLPTGETPLDGTSLVPLMQGGRLQRPAAAFSQYPRRVRNESAPWCDNGILHTDRRDFSHMGFSIRTPEWRYTEWRLWNGSRLEAEWGSAPVAVELYDHRNETVYPTDFDVGEEENVAAAHPAVTVGLAQQLRTLFFGGRT